MATTLINKDIAVAKGNHKCKIKVKVTQEGSSLTFTAKPVAGTGRTLCHKKTIHVYTAHVTETYYVAYGSNTMYMALKVGNQTSKKVSAMPQCATDRVMPGNGWQSWSVTTKQITMTAPAPLTDYTIYLVIGSKKYIVNKNTTEGSGNATDWSGAPVGVSTKVNGSWKTVSNIFVKVNGAWKAVKNVFEGKSASWTIIG